MVLYFHTTVTEQIEEYCAKIEAYVLEEYGDVLSELEFPEVHKLYGDKYHIFENVDEMPKEQNYN